MKLRYIMPLLLLFFLGPACAPKKVVVDTAPGKPAVDSSVAGKQFAQAEELFADEAYEKAAAGYLAFAAAFPGHSRAVEALLKAGSAYFMIGDYTAARKVYRQVASEYPESASAGDARVEIVLTYFYEGQFEELLLEAGTVLNADVTVPQQLKVYAILGDTYMALDSPVDAAYAYARAYEIARGKAGDELYERLKSALRLMERSQINLLTERLESPDMQQVVA